MGCLESALQYRNEYGWSVIPSMARSKRASVIPWKPYQTQLPTDTEIREWFIGKNHNLSIVTGKHSNLTVLDIDCHKDACKEIGKTILGILGDDTCATPVVRSQSGGMHVYLTYTPELDVLGFKAGLKALGIDVKGQGDCITAPPSTGQFGSYEWINNPGEYAVESLRPEQIEKLRELTANSSAASSKEENISTNYRGGKNSNWDEIPLCWDQDFRDNSLYHAGILLARGGASEEQITQVLETLAGSCNPPYPQSEVKYKVRSAMAKAKERTKPLSIEIEEWVSVTSGVFSVTDCYRDLNIVTKCDRGNVRKVIHKLCSEGKVIKDFKRSGLYRKVDDTFEVIDISKATGKEYDIIYPLDIHTKVKTMPKNIIVFAGESNVGKTAFLLNLAILNVGKHRITYLSSEMGAEELRVRTSEFKDVDPKDWNKIRFIERSSNWVDLLDPDGLNIIDFIELNDEFYKVSGIMKEIHDKLRKGVCACAIQKKAGSEGGLGRGGAFSLEKPRLYCSISAAPPDGAEIELVKAKIWRTRENPNGLRKVFKIVSGAQIVAQSGWTRDTIIAGGKRGKPAKAEN